MKKISKAMKPTTPAKPEGLLSLADLDKVVAAGAKPGVSSGGGCDV